MIQLETLIELKCLSSSCASSNCSIRVVQIYPLIEIIQTVPCRAIRVSSIPANSTLPPILSKHPSSPPMILSYTILFDTTTYYDIEHYTMLHYDMLCYAILYYAILHYTTQLYNDILYYAMLHYTMPRRLWGPRAVAAAGRRLPRAASRPSRPRGRVGTSGKSHGTNILCCVCFDSCFVLLLILVRVVALTAIWLCLFRASSRALPCP